MSLGFGLNLEQTQKLIMTPELRQAIKILQLSSLELTDYVNQIILENPLIEAREEDYNFPEPKEKKSSEVDWEDYIEEMRNLPERPMAVEAKQEFTFENMVTRGVSLQEYLLSQLGLIRLKSSEEAMARYLIGNIDTTGYLAVTLEQAARDLRKKVSEIEKILHLVQSLDPPGVGARDLRECLLLQLKQKGLLNEELTRLVQNHLEDIGAGKLQRIAQALDITVGRAQELADMIKSLNPKPGASFGGEEEIRYIVPDVLVQRVEDEYIILVNDTNIPRLTINQTYTSILHKNSKVDEDTRNFVEGKLNQALWLIRSIEQRRMTIYLVSRAIVTMQREFFDRGVKYLRPLTLKQIAEEVGVHESTVSRATANKYMQTPQGIFEFKFFFSSGLNTNKGECASSESIKSIISDIIKEEDITRPYSDQKIADILQERGVKIARRTVTKYREELSIPSAGQRKRY
ncbi:RNA polymerase factor sigma-54 [Thermanaerosceptrum fracticalcis]|uniref:RNA polymerase factor sigma-54 n=1 Tax=Thermanaerosceptrum fracticalcis TaxID=1712410 RepID=A0A7G6E460_THEFR|nr:RNA polymerase factor sigma-54 [Thermanaerosceptrum fracticalcis]QNB46864.1 RNA polymerase factor sigma-54 [Thermanaerosceptrum fracticalcis]